VEKYQVGSLPQDAILTLSADLNWQDTFCNVCVLESKEIPLIANVD
tara:strand:- start:1033 stop:1170 length:138 start_codon:yes stop_codon:yes gene_type:complete